MRMLVLFDLPTGTTAEKKAYSRFRKFLIEDGYQMEQFSVYSRLLLSRDAVNAHERRLRQNLPAAGHVTLLILTEKQYMARKILITASPTKRAPAQADAQMTIVF